MSNLVHKVKDALSSDKHHEQPEGTHGPHSSRAANAADPRIDSDRDHRANPAGTTGTTGLNDTYDNNYTTGSSGLTGTSGVAGLDNRGATGPASRTDGPHSSNLANKADPRVDSDRDYSRNMGANPSGTATTGNYTHGTTATTGTSGLTGTHGITGTTGAYSGSTNAGPHSSNLANKVDPRVDSDLDGSRNVGGTTGGFSTGTTGTSGLTGTHGTHGTTGTSGLTGTHGTTGTTGAYSGSTNAGPHSSNLANKVDPRVDSDRDGSRNLGANPSGTATTGTSGLTGTHGTTGTSGLTGTHGTTGSSGLTGTHGTTGNTYASGPGPAPNTAGPHKSDVLNKADPRVDSDRDGSKTIGQDKTYAQS